jgi:predicted amidophosphoribosyltransferase
VTENKTWTLGPDYPMLQCPRCGAELRASESFCHRCAKLLPEDWVAQEAARRDY